LGALKLRLRTKSALAGFAMLAASLFKFWVDESDDLGQPDPEVIRLLARYVGYVVDPMEDFAATPFRVLSPDHLTPLGSAMWSLLHLFVLFLLWAALALFVGWIIRLIRERMSGAGRAAGTAA